MIYGNVVKKVNPKSSHHEEKIFPFLFCFLFIVSMKRKMLAGFIVEIAPLYVNETVMMACTPETYTVMYVEYFSMKCLSWLDNPTTYTCI